MAKTNRWNGRRDEAMIRGIISDFRAGIGVREMCSERHAHHSFIKAVLDFYKANGKAPSPEMVGSAKSGAEIAVKNVSGTDHRALYCSEVAEAQVEAEERRRRRLIPRNPTQGGAFPVPRERLMAGRA